MDIIVIAGAPGSGKSTIAKALQEKLHGPCFEFGWIPEFRNTPHRELSQAEEESLSFENLALVVKNYLSHGYGNIILTDLDDKRLLDISHVYGDYDYVIISLTIEKDDLIEKRVLDETRSSGYRDVERALRQNQMILDRPLLANEYRVDNTDETIETVVSNILNILQNHLNTSYSHLVPDASQFDSYVS